MNYVVHKNKICTHTKHKGVASHIWLMCWIQIPTFEPQKKITSFYCYGEHELVVDHHDREFVLNLLLFVLSPTCVKLRIQSVKF